MNKNILKKANNKYRELASKYDKFNNVILDNWRGYRFIYDTKDVQKCNNDCQNCPLYQLLKNEKEKEFSASLYKASPKDKKLFGPQKYLNCKTIKQYQDCFITFITTQCKTEKEVFSELDLIKNLKIIYAIEKSPLRATKEFKLEVIEKTLQKAKPSIERIIKKYLFINKDFYGGPGRI